MSVDDSVAPTGGGSGVSFGDVRVEDLTKLPLGRSSSAPVRTLKTAKYERGRGMSRPRVKFGMDDEVQEKLITTAPPRSTPQPVVPTPTPAPTPATVPTTVPEEVPPPDTTEPTTPSTPATTTIEEQVRYLINDSLPNYCTLLPFG